MDRSPWALRACAVVVLAVSTTACAARSATPALTGPSPFPVPASPASIAPDALWEFAPVAPADLLQTALGLQGVPYTWGGQDPATGFDCSGFVKYVLAHHQMPAPRTAAEQFLRLGVRVGLRQLRAGDLVFFSTIAPGASHVGLAISSTEFVHAPASRGVVRIDQIGDAYWRSRFVGARRILPPALARPGSPSTIPSGRG